MVVSAWRKTKQGKPAQTRLVGHYNFKSISQGKVSKRTAFEKRSGECARGACSIWWKSIHPEGTKSVKSPEAGACC